MRIIRGASDLGILQLRLCGGLADIPFPNIDSKVRNVEKEEKEAASQEP